MPAVSKSAMQVQPHMKSKSSSKRVALATPASTPTRSALGAAGRVDSPDSVFFDSNIGSSHLSSASGSAGRCSFGSDHPDSLVLSEVCSDDLLISLYHHPFSLSILDSGYLIYVNICYYFNSMLFLELEKSSSTF